MIDLRTDVLIIGAGAAGMYAAISASKAGADVLLVDKSMVGRGGATIMAQMTVAAAIGAQEQDDWEAHYRDSIAAGHGLCNEGLTRIMCQEGPDRILEMDTWRVGWARNGQQISQVVAPGHNRRRCVYVDFLNSGPAIAATLQRQVKRLPHVRRLSNVNIVELLVDNGQVVGAVGLDVESARTVTFRSGAVVLAAGGLTKLYARNSASTNLGGDAYALAGRAGAALVDMEFVQFFPIAHLAPRLVGMDPIMWDPFRYKLGGKLLNGQFEEFLGRYGTADEGKYTATRDLATYAILKEVEAGRGTPHGGAYLDFRHVPETALREAFGPVIDRLLDNGIDLTRTPVEVAPMAHFHMGGVLIDTSMQSSVPGLYAAGEAVGGSHGANRLSGNALTEAMVFGERAGRFAAEAALALTGRQEWAAGAAKKASQGVEKLIEQLSGAASSKSPVSIQHELQWLMHRQVGPLRGESDLKDALVRIQTLARDLPTLGVDGGQPFDLSLQDWFELRNMLQVAEGVTLAALARTESRGAHQREDFPHTDPTWEKNLVLRWLDVDDEPLLESRPVVKIVPEEATS